MSAQPLILQFKEISKDDVSLVGGKGANLGEMTNSDFPVPLGFAITIFAYDKFLEHNGFKNYINKILSKVDVNDSSILTGASKTIQKKILSGEFPKDVSKEVIKAYKKLSGFLGRTLVAVRSSATAEDLPGASFAGQQSTYLNIKGEANLLIAVRECWASLFTPRAIFYRTQNKIREDKVKISVIVQKMIQSEVSGVMFSIDPVTNDKGRIIIESVWGLGEMIVQGSVVPDKYVVQKGTFAILSKEISDQSIQLVSRKAGSGSAGKVSDGNNVVVDVPKKLREKPKLLDEEIIKLAKISQKLQNHYYFPQDTEWAKEKNKLYIVQTRPVTTLAQNSKAKTQNLEDEKQKTAEFPILKGNPASPGIGNGVVKVLKSAKEIEKIQKGDVLVAPMTSPDFVPAMKKASAIVTDQGGQTSHAAIVSRELGIPCIVGAEVATKELKDGMVVSVNGSTGEVFLGSKVALTKGKEVEIKSTKKTATKLYVNLAEPERASEISKLNVDGVGLLRAEFMIANIGIHPKEAIQRREQDKFIRKLANDITIFCKNFNPRPVVYRATDFKTNEYRSLPGGKSWEPEEPNPMLGFRGAFRYISNPDVFNLELQAIKKVRENYKNLWLMIPFVRSPQELQKVRRIVASEGLFESSSFKFWMMVEIPANVILLEDFIKVGIDGVSIGSNDLTMLIEGTDRDNSEVAREFNERSPAVLWALKRVIKSCNKHGVSSSICGQAPSSYDDLVEELVSLGITSISVNPDSVGRVRDVIANAERKLVS